MKHKLLLSRLPVVILLVGGLESHAAQPGKATVRLVATLSILSQASPPTERITYRHPIPFAPEKYVCYKSESPVVIDGVIDEQWSKAEWTCDFRDIQGDLKPTPKYRTHAKLLWDDDYLYIAARLEEPHIWGTLTMRDAVIFYDNDFEIFIDPDGDTHAYYEFEMNALNTVWDLLLERPYRDGCRALFAWDISGLKTAVHVEGTLNHTSDVDQYWSVEVAMPWRILKEHAPHTLPQEYEQWRIGFSRVEWWTEIVDGAYIKKKDKDGKRLPEENWVWGSTGFINMHMPEMWPFVQFTHTLVGHNKIAFIDRPDEQVKWGLRQLYYMQKNYRKEHGSYATSLDDFVIPEVAIEGYMFRPSIENVTGYYQISASSADGTGTVSINSRGRTWFSNRRDAPRKEAGR